MLSSNVTQQSMARQSLNGPQTKSQSPTPKINNGGKNSGKTGITVGHGSTKIEKQSSTGSISALGSKKLFQADAQKKSLAATNQGNNNQSHLAEYYSRNERSNKGSPDSTAHIANKSSKVNIP